MTKKENEFMEMRKPVYDALDNFADWMQKNTIGKAQRERFLNCLKRGVLKQLKEMEEKLGE